MLGACNRMHCMHHRDSQQRGRPSSGHACPRRPTTCENLAHAHAGWAARAHLDINSKVKQQHNGWTAAACSAATSHAASGAGRETALLQLLQLLDQVSINGAR
jgi:hypothetical protein